MVVPPAQMGYKCLKSEEKIEEGGKQILAINVTVGRSRKMIPPSPVHHPRLPKTEPCCPRTHLLLNIFCSITQVTVPITLKK